jgi:hypothetical protein
MKPITKRILLTGVLILSTPLRLLLFWLSKHYSSNNGKEIRFGKCVFVGDDQTNALVTKTMDSIKDSDPLLFQRLTKVNRYWFFFFQDALFAIPHNGTFIINENYIRWGTDGVLTFLIYSVNYSEMARKGGFRPVSFNELLEARRKTVAHLEEIGINGMLIDLFRDKPLRPAQ